MIERKCSVNEFLEIFIAHIWCWISVWLLLSYFFLQFPGIGFLALHTLSLPVFFLVNFKFRTKNTCNFLLRFLFLLPLIFSFADDEAQTISLLHTITSHRVGLDICPLLSHFHKNHNINDLAQWSFLKWSVLMKNSSIKQRNQSL